MVLNKFYFYCTCNSNLFYRLCWRRYHASILTCFEKTKFIFITTTTTEFEWFTSITLAVIVETIQTHTAGSRFHWLWTFWIYWGEKKVKTFWLNILSKWYVWHIPCCAAYWPNKIPRSTRSVRKKRNWVILHKSQNSWY